MPIARQVYDHTTHHCCDEVVAGKFCSAFFRLDIDATKCPDGAAMKQKQLEEAEATVAKLKAELV